MRADPLGAISRIASNEAWRRAAAALVLGIAGCGVSDGEETDQGTLVTERAALTGGNDCANYGLNFEPQENGATTGTFSIGAQADAELDLGTPTMPNGTATTLTVDGGTDPQKNVLMRFDVRDFVSVTSATLKFYVSNGSVDGPLIVLAADAWSESTVTYSNYDSVGWSRQVTDYGSITTGQKSLDVTSFIDRNGIYSFEFIGQNADGTILSSRENGTSSQRPVLSIVGTKNPALNPLTACAPYWPAPYLSGTMFSEIPPEGNTTSGLAAAHGTNMIGVIYQVHDHNMSEAYNSVGRNFYAINPSGARLATYTLSGVNYMNPEEIQVGPGPRGETSYVYIADIGDNSHNAANVNVYRVEEPTVLQDTTYLPGDYQTLTLTYEGGIKINAEAMIIDPLDGTLYVIEKACFPDGDPNLDNGAGTVRGKNRIFYVKAPLPFGGSAVLKNSSYYISLAETQYPSCNARGCVGCVTAASASRNGSILAVTSYNEIYSWFRPTMMDLGQTLFQTSTAGGYKCPQSQTSEFQREAITFGNCNDVSPSPYVLTAGEGNSGSSPAGNSIWGRP